MLTRNVNVFHQAHKEEDKKYSEVKNGLRVQIRDMRRTVSACNHVHDFHIPWTL